VGRFTASLLWGIDVTLYKADVEVAVERVKRVKKEVGEPVLT